MAYGDPCMVCRCHPCRCTYTTGTSATLGERQHLLTMLGAASLRESELEQRALAAEEEAMALRLRVAELEVTVGELVGQLDHSVYVSERPDYCRVCDRYFPW